MASSRLVAPVLAGALALVACSEKSSEMTYTIDGAPKAGEKPAAPAPAPAEPAATQPKPAETPAATAQPAAPAPAATTPAETPAAASAIPASGDPAKRLDPKFYLPPDSSLTTTASGLKYLIVSEGNGTSPGKTATVTVHYSGWLTDGQPFDSSYARGEEISFRLDQVIAGWTEGLQLMRPGGEAILVIPAKIGYGESGAPPVIPPNATLVFRVELLSTSG